MCNVNGLRVESNHHLELKQTLELSNMMYRLKSWGWRELSEVPRSIQPIKEQSWVHIPSSPDFWWLTDPVICVHLQSLATTYNSRNNPQWSKVVNYNCTYIKNMAADCCDHLNVMSSSMGPGVQTFAYSAQTHFLVHKHKIRLLFLSFISRKTYSWW